MQFMLTFTSPPPEFDFVALEVGLVLHHFDETLRRDEEATCQQKIP